MTPGRRAPFRRLLESVPNALTALRLLLVPVLWVVALLGLPVYLGWGVAVAALTDVLDGIVARWTGSATAFGSRFDSLADHLLTASVALWILLLRPGFVREEWKLLLLWAVLGLAVLGVGWVKFGRVGGLHLYSAKAASVAGYLFAVYLLVSGGYRPAVFHLVVGACVAAALESLLVLLTRSRVDEHVGSILLRRPGGSRR